MFIRKKKYLNVILNKRQIIRCKTYSEAIKLMNYLNQLGFCQETTGGIIELPYDGWWDEFQDKTVYYITPSPIYGRVQYGSIDTTYDKKSVKNFSDLF